MTFTWRTRLVAGTLLVTAAGSASCARADHPARSGAATRLEAPRPPSREACAGESGVDLRHHDVDLTLHVSSASIAGRGDLQVRARRDTGVVVLDAKDLRVASVASGGAALPFRLDDGRLCAALLRPLRAGEGATIHVEWTVDGERRVPRFLDDEVWAGYATSSWMPTRDDPAQRATLTLRIAAPPDLRVAASGRAAPASARDGLAVHAFTMDRPSPPFLFGFAAGRFDEASIDVDGVTLRALGPKGADLKSALAITAPMMRSLRERTGARFPADAYTEVFVRDDAAQEAAGLSFLSASALDEVRADPTEDWLFSHELAHQWFAWLVSCADFSDFWLNEGFATFFVAALKEERWGRPAYDRELGLWRARSAKVHESGRDAPLSLSPPGAAPRSPRDSELQPRGVTYARGALTLDALRGELGDPTFWAGIQRYVRDRAEKGARSEDLRAAFEAVSGRDLRPFFARRVYAPAPEP